VLLATACGATTTNTAAKPNVVMVLGDDIGWGNVEWNREVPTKEVQTPNLAQLVADGIELTSFYTFKYCSPSRSAFMSGRNPIHVNVVNGDTTLINPEDPVSGYSGMPINMTSVANKMHAAGYKTHAVGKWDIGIASFYHTPAGRGFESWLGYFGHCNDYWSMLDKCGMTTCDGTISMVDLWEQSNSGAISRPAADKNNSQTCSQTNQEEGCMFEDDIFFNQVTSIVQGHADYVAETKETSEDAMPLFLFWAAHACHGPLEVPQATFDKFSFIGFEPRQKYQSLIFYLDGLIGNVVTQLKTLGMWENTLFVFSSDNGGDGEANNYPHRGAKFSNWQGGIHVPAFVSGGYLPPSRRGIKLNGLTTLWDLYATFGTAGGLSATDATSDVVAAAAKLPAVDSKNQLAYWMGNTTTPPRTEIAVGTAYGNSHGGGNQFEATSIEALIRNDMKLILTAPGQPLDEAIWTGPQYPNASSNQSAWLDAIDCSKGCLYNLTADPNEHNDVSSLFPSVVAEMTAAIYQINETAFSPHRGLPSPIACQVALEEYHGFWGPFVGANTTVPQNCSQEMKKVCPLANFSSYPPCRQCLKTAFTTTHVLDACMPAAPPKFQAYCDKANDTLAEITKNN